jgi:hypothetical protein
MAGAALAAAYLAAFAPGWLPGWAAAAAAGAMAAAVAVFGHDVGTVLTKRSARWCAGRFGRGRTGRSVADAAPHFDDKPD